MLLIAAAVLRGNVENRENKERLCVCVCVCACVCVCLYEREREIERERKKERLRLRVKVRERGRQISREKVKYSGRCNMYGIDGRL